MRASASAATNFNTSSYHPLWRAVALVPAVVAVLLCLGTYGCAPASALPGGDAPGELMFGGLPRTYQVHVPAGLDHPAGLVINLAMVQGTIMETASHLAAGGCSSSSPS